MSLLATAGISALIKYGPSLIRLFGERKGGATEKVAHTIADVVEAVNGDTSPSSVAKVKATVDSLPPEVVGEIELGLAQIEAEREKARLTHDLGMHTQQQETLRSGKEIKTFRPEIARRHSWFTVAYIFVMELLNAFDYGSGANWEIALLIASPVLAWFGFRTWDKFSKQGAS
ncbi:hypothetical protein MHN00_14060 [Alteromonas sp. Cnat2-8]|jgi:hypothetical protein|uniref:hypothetical protein n=1 Tax=Alteromonas sp. Cnat2-8 TaxID=2917728 RepID=UPI001EF4CBFE|nr:hypothetical protein [Alteromonas sp. Cnat2-8]MCG7654679.1 hypothetical protein [Alteromonas sp. Cnat2-8]